MAAIPGLCCVRATSLRLAQAFSLRVPGVRRARRRRGSRRIALFLKAEFYIDPGDRVRPRFVLSCVHFPAFCSSATVWALMHH